MRRALKPACAHLDHALDLCGFGAGVHPGIQAVSESVDWMGPLACVPGHWQGLLPTHSARGHLSVDLQILLQFQDSPWAACKPCINH